jgi:presenilin-like A22 family membrane protease
MKTIIGMQNTSQTAMKKGMRVKPVYWSIFFFIFAQMLTFFTISHVDVFLETNQVYIPPQPPPEVITLWPGPAPVTPEGEQPQAPPWTALGPILIYFFAVTIALGLFLFLIPLSILRSGLRVLFAFLFSWGFFIILIFWLPVTITIIISVAAGLAWFLVPRVWLHDLMMIVAMASLATVFGRIISPWTVMVLLLVLAVYDFLSVRFGYMIWMVKKLSDSNTLPALIIPRDISGWNSSTKQTNLTKLIEEKPSDRDYSILGGGDVGFPLLLVSSVYFAYGFTNGILVAVFSLIGLACAYWIQSAFLKGESMPALPPIAVISLVALLVVRGVSL